MIGTPYRAIREKEDGSYETDGYIVIDRLYDGFCRVDSYGGDLFPLESSFQKEKKNPVTGYETGWGFPEDDRSYVLMVSTDMKDLLSIRKALDRLNRIEQREWGIESIGLDASIYVRSFSGGKVRIADYTRRGRLELHSEHSTLTRHFIGAANREGICAIMEEPGQMHEEMYERMGRCLQEIAGKYGFQCGKAPGGSWYLGVQTDRTRRVFLRMKRESGMQDCLCLSENVHEILEDFIRSQDHFSQENAWALADDLNGLCGRMAPCIIPIEGIAYGRNAKGIRIGDLFPGKTLAELPHSADGKKVSVWELKQAYLRGTADDLRDTMIGFFRNVDNAVSNPEAVAYLGEMIQRNRLDTVRELNGERLKEITKETLEKSKQAQSRGRIRRGEKKQSIPPSILWQGAKQGEPMYVAEKATVYADGLKREVAR